MAIVSFAEFQQAVTSNNFPAPSKAKYDGYIRALHGGGVTDRREAAVFLAQILHESGGLQYTREIRPLSIYGIYFGRGYIQLTGEENYRDASYALYADDRLVHKPEQVADSDVVAWFVTGWYWRNFCHIDPAVCNGDMAAATRCINPKTPHHERRQAIYENVRSAFRTTAVAGGRRVYRVRQGDDLTAIARAHGLPLDALKEANPGINYNMIFPGQEIYLPGAA